MLASWCNLGCSWHVQHNAHRVRPLRCGMTNSPKPLSAFTSAAAGVLQSLPAGLQVVLRNPSLFRLSAAELDDRRVLMVALQERLSLEEAELVSIIVACPSLLSMRFAEEVEPRLSQLQARLQLSEKTLRTVVLGAPLVLGAGASRVEAQLVLLESHGLSVAQLRRAVVARPSLLELSVAETRAAIAGLQKHLRLPEKQLAGLLAGQPRVLWGCEERLAELAARYGLSRTQLRQVRRWCDRWAMRTRHTCDARAMGMHVRVHMHLQCAAGGPRLAERSREGKGARARAGAAAQSARAERGARPPPHISPYLPISPHISLYLLYLELSEVESRRVLVKNPMLLGQSYEKQLLPMCAATQARRVHAACACRVHGVCMACAWRVHGVCTPCACRVHAALCMPCVTSVGGESQIRRGCVQCPFLCAPWQ